MNPHDYEHMAAGLDDDAGPLVAINSVAAPARSTGARGQFNTEPLPKSTVVLTCGADLTPEPVQWLWPDWLALGKFHLLAGALDLSDSAILLDGDRRPTRSRHGTS